MAMSFLGLGRRFALPDRRQRLADVPAPPLPGSDPPPARSTANPIGLHRFSVGTLLVADDLNHFVDALLALDTRLAAIEAKLDMTVAS